ncbi:MAG: methylglyoxal reductase (NADPH-dependent) gre2 [Peltula sp. TS41687]|nr:MAG: methylglyoxal reductase (NADPH-dependent) gre2 [Peltula sp. TS41687]
MRVLLTGGSGFIAAHVLAVLLDHGHSVVTTVRSEDKAKQIKSRYPNLSTDQLDFAIVKDIAQEGAFEQAVVSDPPFEAVIHTASPFHFNFENVQQDMLDPAINGTVGLLKAVKAKVPSVKRVIITSSFAAITNPGRKWDGYVYSEKDWNPITLEQALSKEWSPYQGSKTFAERAAWDFVEKEKPNFTLSTINPPLVLGPVVHHITSLSAINTSNATIAGLIKGELKNGLEAPRSMLWVDVRDLALAHVQALEKPAAAGKRFFVTAGQFSDKEVTEIIAAEFPEYHNQLPTGEGLEKGALPPKGQRVEYDNTWSKEVLGLEYRPLKEAVIDAVKSLKAVQTDSDAV